MSLLCGNGLPIQAILILLIYVSEQFPQIYKEQVSKNTLQARGAVVWGGCLPALQVPFGSYRPVGWWADIFTSSFYKYEFVWEVRFTKGMTVTAGDALLCSDFPSLRYLEFNKASIHPDAISGFARCGALESVAFEGIVLTGDHLVHLQQLRQIKFLRFRNTELPHDWAIYLREMQHLIDLNVIYNRGRGKLDAASAVVLAQLKQLQYLEFDNVDLPPNIGDIISQLPQLTSLASINSRFDNDQVAKLQHSAKLEVLHLVEPCIGDQALPVIAGLPNLWELVLDDTAITDAGLVYLAQNPSLQRLSITNTRITNDGLRALANSPKLKFARVEGTAVDRHASNFVGRLRDGLWYPPRDRNR